MFQSQIPLALLSIAVGINGLLLIVSTLFERLTKHGVGENTATLALPLLIGITFVYLSTLLRRRKQTAWAVTTGLYIFLLGNKLTEVLHVHHDILSITRNIIYPVVVLLVLVLYRKQFRVRSDLRNFAGALRFSAFIVLCTFIYGTIGFMTLGTHDFHKTVSLPEAMHRTVDQFNLTTGPELHPYTRRAHLFLDSLSIISTVSVAYIFISLFQPLKARITEENQHDRQIMSDLLVKYSRDSEDFFKVWPHDKHYFFNQTGDVGIAYYIQSGIAICVGDPVGEKKKMGRLITSFSELCFVNDWDPIFVHILSGNRDTYHKFNFEIQKLGEEAVVDTEHFIKNVEPNKYFRNIKNKFERQGYTTELLVPPHNPAILSRLREVSDDWLQLPGRSERGLMMGYFDKSYMDQCNVMVLRDAAGTILAFINEVKTHLDKDEADYDLLRYTKKALGNTNDYLIMSYIKYLHENGYKTLNMGLCPLSGLQTEEDSTIANVLRFAYANGNKLYSFKGLRRFKEKYEPNWRGRYVAYRGGVRGFTGGMYALTKAMTKTARHSSTQK